MSMKPVLIQYTRKAAFNPPNNHNQLVAKFYFPKGGLQNAERGEIKLINGDVPRVIIKVERGEIKIDKEK